MTTVSKKVGGPKALVGFTMTGGYILFRAAEEGVKRGAKSIKERRAPCPTLGMVFQVTTDGDDTGVQVRVGDEYRVLESDGEAILIEVLDDPNSPCFVSSSFLRSVSEFPSGESGRRV